MCESLNPARYPWRKASSPKDDGIDEEEKKIEDSFTELSAHVISELIKDEPDSYSIEDVKVRYK